MHSMHTMAKVKNAALADGDAPEPPGREIGEEQVVEAADRLVANTDDEARAAGRPVRRRPGQGRGRPARASTSTCSARRTGRAARAAARACRPTPSCCCSSAGSSRSRPPTSCCAPRPSCSRDRPGAARPAGRRRGRRPERQRPGARQSRLQRLAVQLGHRRTWSGSRRRSRRPSSPTGTARPTWSAVPSYSESLRAGRGRGAGLRHPGRRRRRRRPAHRRRRRPSRASWSTTTSPAHWANVIGDLLVGSGWAATRSRAARSRTRPGSAGTRPPTRCSTSTAGRSDEYDLLARSGLSRGRRRDDERAAQPPPQATVAAYLVRAEIEHEPGARPGRVRRRPARRAQAAHGGVAPRRRPLAVGVGVRRAARRREPRGVYRWLLERNARMYGVAFALDGAATSTWSAGCRWPRSRRRARPAARCGPRDVRRLVRRAARARLRSVDPAGVGLAGRAGESTRNLEAFRQLLEPRPEP